MTYTISDVEQIQESLAKHFPVVRTSLSKLGGPKTSTVIIKLTLDERSTWINGIYENSRFSMFSLNQGKLEQIAKHYNVAKFRKSTIQSNQQAIDKIIFWLSKQ